MANLSSRASRQRLAGRVGGLSVWVDDREGALARLAAARRAFDAKFATERDRSLFFARLSLKAAQARAKKAKGKGAVTRP